MSTPIRPGCYVEFTHQLGSGYTYIIKGFVISHYYESGGYHYFTIQHGKRQITVGAAQVYKNLQNHRRGEESIIFERRARKRGLREKKRRERHQRKQYKRKNLRLK